MFRQLIVILSIWRFVVITPYLRSGVHAISLNLFGNNAQATEKRYCRNPNDHFVCSPGMSWSWGFPLR